MKDKKGRRACIKDLSQYPGAEARAQSPACAAPRYVVSIADPPAMCQCSTLARVLQVADISGFSP